MDKKLARSIPISGEKLRQFRIELGWTQRDLAEKSGYSVRLIRKAEGSGMLDLSTASNLAEALSVYGRQVSIACLSLNESVIAKGVLRLFDDNSGVESHAAFHDLSDSLILNCSGDPKRLDCSGEWLGHDGFQCFVKAFCRVFKCKPHANIVLTSACIAIARIEAIVHSSKPNELTHQSIPVFVTLNWTNHKISRIEVVFDSHMIERSDPLDH